MIHVRRHKRQTASGKTTTVRAHEREGGDGVSEAPEWAQPVSAADFQPGLARRLASDVREVHAEDRELRDDLRSGRKAYGTDWRSGSTDPAHDPDDWWADDADDEPDDGMSPAFRAMVAQNPQLGGERFEKLRALREGGYTGPIDQDGNPVDG